jgi:hypothetical protein
MSTQVYPLASSLGGAAASPEWTQITDIDGATLWDPDGHLGGATGFDGDVFTLEWVGLAARVDGWQENCPRWAWDVQSVFPSYDKDIHTVEAYMEVVQADGAGQRLGVGVHIMGGGDATANGGGFGYDETTAGAWSMWISGQSGMSDFNTVAPQIDVLHGTLHCFANYVCAAVGAWNGVVWASGDSEIKTQLGAPSEDVKLVVMGVNRLTTAPTVGSTQKVRLFVKLVPRGDLPPT